MWAQFGSKLQKFLKCGRPGGGGSSVISDTPGRGGEGGSKRANFCGRPLWMAPYRNTRDHANCDMLSRLPRPGIEENKSDEDAEIFAVKMDDSFIDARLIA